MSISLTWEQPLHREVEMTIECWVEDGGAPRITRGQLALLYHHIEITVIRQRTEYHMNPSDGGFTT